MNRTYTVKLTVTDPEVIEICDRLNSSGNLSQFLSLLSETKVKEVLSGEVEEVKEVQAPSPAVISESVLTEHLNRVMNLLYDIRETQEEEKDLYKDRLVDVLNSVGSTVPYPTSMPQVQPINVVQTAAPVTGVMREQESVRSEIAVTETAEHTIVSTELTPKPAGAKKSLKNLAKLKQLKG